MLSAAKHLDAQVRHAERGEASPFRDEPLRYAQGDTVLRMTFRIPP